MSFKGQQIRRYANRKLYSITESRYLTLPEIGKMFTEGCGFIVRDLKTDEDLTVKYLVKALASIGYFDEQIKVRNVSNIGANLEEAGITVHG
tara:strand:+ start:859 stop:1134 length:276 start_codon:yes stop_codon:yes gene_type:complete